MQGLRGVSTKGRTLGLRIIYVGSTQGLRKVYAWVYVESTQGLRKVDAGSS